ncbi:MAG: dihydrolipoyllysine-residue acetyltransferase [Cytophagales bacterium]|nr:dihydrolipoyllysine-residue acetyltransferase [Cytophagales bacterium]
MANVQILVPDIGDFDEVTVIELLVKAGDTVKVEQSLITVESDKASMEIPSSHAGVVIALKVKLGDKVKMGSLVAELDAAGGASTAASTPAGAAPAPAGATPTPAGAAPTPAGVAPTPAGATPTSVRAEPVEAQAPSTSTSSVRTEVAAASAHESAPAHEPATQTAQLATLPNASPSVRKYARELGVPLAEVRGSGANGRITEEDVQAFTQAVMSGSKQTAAQAASSKASGAGASADGAALGLLPWPKVDFAKFGPVERKDLSRIKKISGANLHRNWVMIPHVTNNDEADITDLEALRVKLNKEHEKAGVKFTMLAFLIKACVAALKKFPEFNASLDGDQLVYKQYVHIGFAADTPNGLVVPVIRDADKKGLIDIAKEMTELSLKAREGKLKPAEMSGGCFSISSLGGIGGTNFTPIINAPELAILGVSKSKMQPVWDGKQFVPRLMMPLSLSYDHRVIDGAAAARLNAFLTAVLADFRRVAL